MRSEVYRRGSSSLLMFSVRVVIVVVVSCRCGGWSFFLELSEQQSSDGISV